MKKDKRPQHLLYLTRKNGSRILNCVVVRRKYTSHIVTYLLYVGDKNVASYSIGDNIVYAKTVCEGDSAYCEIFEAFIKRFAPVKHNVVYEL